MNGLEPAAYRDGAMALNGWLARPDGPARAAIVVYPTIANITPRVAQKAARLAQAGFLVLVADYYGQSIDSFEMAGPLAQALRADNAAYRRRLSSAIAAIRTLPQASGLPVGAMGFCMGGQAALEMARHGDKDPMIPREQVGAFMAEMDAAQADWHLHIYANAKHGFTDPASDQRPLPAVAYDASADRQSWAAMMNLFGEIFPPAQ